MVRAIVIDDDFNTVEIFTEYLEIQGINVVAKGYNGDEAVKLFQIHKPDVVFLDVMMEPVDGIFALEQIRRIDPNAIVIMVTADLRADTETKLTELNASAIVYKPYDIKQILELVNKFTANIVLVKSKEHCHGGKT